MTTRVPAAIHGVAGTSKGVRISSRLNAASDTSKSQGTIRQIASRGSRLIPALVALVLFALYAATACRTVGPGDSGELVVAMCTWGVPHAPGYPLLTLIGNLISHLPHPGEPALLLNLLNALFAALACGLIARAVGEASENVWAGAVAGLALGTSRVFWEYALAVEVFSLNALMAAVLLWLLARFLRGLREARPVHWPLPATALVLSTCLTHHLTLALLGAPVLLVYLALIPVMVRAGHEPRALLRTAWIALGAGLLGLLPLLYIPIAAHFDPALNWGDVRALGDFWRLIARRDFGSGTLMAPEVAVGRLFENGERASPLGMRHFGLFWSDLPRSCGALFPVVMLLGLVETARRHRPLLIVAAGFLAALTLFFTRVNTPVVPLFIGVTERFYILPHVVFAFLFGLGVAAAMEFAGRRHRAGRSVTCAAIALGTGLLLIPLNGPRVSLRVNTFTRDFGANLMAGMPREAIVCSSGDLFTNSFHYQREALGRRRDLTLIHQPQMTTAWYLRQLRRRGALRLPPAMVAYTGDSATGTRAWLDLNAGDAVGTGARPIVVVQFLDDTYRSAYRLDLMGLWSAVRPLGAPPDLGHRADAYSEVVRSWELRSLDQDYPATSWEASESVFYTYALANLQAIRDIARLAHPGQATSAAVPALERAKNWKGRRRADYLAYQAECWRGLLDEGEVAPGAPADSVLAERSMTLARVSLAVDGDNLQALQTLAALLSDVPRFRDARTEAEIRFRIVRQRPGDLAELDRYFRLVRSLSRDDAASAASLRAQSEGVRRRYVGLLEMALRLMESPVLRQLRERWSSPVL